MWYAWIQNKELQVILMYMFPIKPSLASEMVHFHKNRVCAPGKIHPGKIHPWQGVARAIWEVASVKVQNNETDIDCR